MALPGYRVHAPDLLGHGLARHEPPWSLEDQVEATLAVGVGPAVWIGHSYGCRVALEVAARRPDLVSALVFLDPVIWLPPQVARFVAEDALTDRTFDSVAEALERRYEESKLYGAPRNRVRAEIARHLVQLPDGRLRYRYAQSAVVAALGELTCTPPPFTMARVPTLLVRGDQSYVPYEHLLDEHRSALGALLTEVVVKGGHTVLWDAFEGTAAAIQAWLDNLG